MYHDKPFEKRSVLIVRALAVSAAAASLLFCFFSVFAHIEKDLNENGARSLKETVLQSALQCYAVEGSYPPSLRYLEENYGLQINHKRYFVTYEIFASNILPQVTVLPAH